MEDLISNLNNLIKQHEDDLKTLREAKRELEGRKKPAPAKPAPKPKAEPEPEPEPPSEPVGEPRMRWNNARGEWEPMDPEVQGKEAPEGVTA